jgi:alkylhydroperoxidase family enzyme
VLDYSVAVTRTPVEVPDELFAALRRHFNEAQLVELTAAIAWENYRARFNHAFGIEAQGFSDGAYCPLPERAGEAHAAHNSGA